MFMIVIVSRNDVVIVKMIDMLIMEMNLFVELGISVIGVKVKIVVRVDVSSGVKSKCIVLFNVWSGDCFFVLSK